LHGGFVACCGLNIEALPNLVVDVQASNPFKLGLEGENVWSYQRWQVGCVIQRAIKTLGMKGMKQQQVLLNL
jgi:hypothetical protein